MAEAEAEVKAEETGFSRATRIFVGGVSPSVAADDLERIFSSLGRVRNVEFVRTDGRSFAYVDFEPFSDKSLPKLFSTYNGCTWKGGKLRIEKAKEHYLARLKREWHEDIIAQETANDAEKDKDEPKPEITGLENLKLHIFFPKLKKVKLLPFKGTGKHKYSFQRIEVPSLPLHFCDCEEHCGPSEEANEKYGTGPSSAAYEKELSIMNSVMNKLFDEEDVKTASSQMQQPATYRISVEFTENEIQPNEAEESHEENSDDLIINIGSRQSEESLLQLNVQSMKTANQEPQFRRRQCVKETPPVQKSQKSASAETMRSSGTLSNMGSKIIRDEFSPRLAKSKRPTDSQHFGDSKEASSIKTPNELILPTSEPPKSNSWIQKSSWRDLVGESCTTSFSISHVLPGISLLAAKPPNTDDKHAAVSALTKKRKDRADHPIEKSIASSVAEVLKEVDRGTVAGCQSVELDKNTRKETRRPIPEIKIGEVCPFMRSSESEKEWKKAKRALSGYIKKKGNESNTSNILKHAVAKVKG